MSRDIMVTLWVVVNVDELDAQRKGINPGGTYTEDEDTITAANGYLRERLRDMKAVTNFSLRRAETVNEWSENSEFAPPVWEAKR